MGVNSRPGRRITPQAKYAWHSARGRARARQNGDVKVEIRVKPGASRTRVGGSHGERLVVAVGARAVDGAATDAALAAVADAFGVRRRCVTLVVGPTSRDKVVDVDVPDPAAAEARLAELLAR